QGSRPADWAGLYPRGALDRLLFEGGNLSAWWSSPDQPQHVDSDWHRPTRVVLYLVEDVGPTTVYGGNTNGWVLDAGAERGSLRACGSRADMDAGTDRGIDPAMGGGGNHRRDRPADRGHQERGHRQGPPHRPDAAGHHAKTAAAAQRVRFHRPRLHVADRPSGRG